MHAAVSSTLQEGQADDYALAINTHRGDTTSLSMRCVLRSDSSVGRVLTMRAVFPLTPSEDLKAGQY